MVAAGLSSCCPFPCTLRAAKNCVARGVPSGEVDVEVYPPRIPPGRNLRGQAILADDDAWPSTVLRSSRNGISFSPMNMLFVPGGATIEQSITRPRLHVLGLRGWIEALTAQDQPTALDEIRSGIGSLPVLEQRSAQRC